MKKTFILFGIITCSQAFSQVSAYSTPRQYNQYIPPVNTEFVRDVLSAKQNQYDKNIEKVYDKTTDIAKLINKIYIKQNYKFSENQNKYINSYDKFIKSITKSQLSSNSETYSILKTLEGVEDQLYKILYP